MGIMKFFRKDKNEKEQIQEEEIQKIEFEKEQIQKAEIQNEKIQEQEKPLSKKQRIINVTKKISKELNKEIQMNYKISKGTFEELIKKTKPYIKKEKISKTDILNVITAFFLESESKNKKEFLKIINTKNKKEFSVTFKLTQDEILFLYQICKRKNINITESFFQVCNTKIGEMELPAKKPLLNLLLSCLDGGISPTLEEKELLQNETILKTLNNLNSMGKNLNQLLKEIHINGYDNEKIKNFEKEITEISDNIKTIKDFFKRI